MPRSSLQNVQVTTGHHSHQASSLSSALLGLGRPCREAMPGGHSQGACARSSLETTLSSNLTSSLFLVAETQGNKIHGQTAVSSPALPPPAMPGSCTQVQRCGCPTGRRTAGVHKLVTADCAVGCGGSVTQSTAPRSGQAADLPRTLPGVPRAQRCVW